MIVILRPSDTNSKSSWSIEISSVLLKPPPNPTSIIDPAALLTDKAGAEIYTVGAYDAARNALMSNFQTGWLNIWGVMAVDEIVSP